MDVPALRAVLWIGILANAGSFVGGLLPALVRLRLHGTAADFGAIQSVAVVGAVAGGAVVGWAERRLGVRGVLIAAMACNAAAYAIFAASTSVALTAGAAAFDAMVTPLTSVPITAILQAESPPDRLGRVGGTFSPVASAVAPPAALLGGWLADLFGPAPIFVLSAVWALGLVAVAWRSAPLHGVSFEAG
jgi:MFS family permease